MGGIQFFSLLFSSDDLIAILNENRIFIILLSGFGFEKSYSIAPGFFPLLNCY